MDALSFASPLIINRMSVGSFDIPPITFMSLPTWTSSSLQKASFTCYPSTNWTPFKKHIQFVTQSLWDLNKNQQFRENCRWQYLDSVEDIKPAEMMLSFYFSLKCFFEMRSGRSRSAWRKGKTWHERKQRGKFLKLSFFLRDIVHRKEILGDKTVESGRDYQRLEIFQRLLK